MTSNNRQQQIKVLVVEDEAVAALSLKRGLRLNGYDVCGMTATGEEAVELSISRKPDVILMDIFLAGEIDGFEAARTIRTQAADIPIIFLTGFADKWVMEKTKALGKADILFKPFVPEEIIKILDKILKRNGEGNPTL